MGRILQNGGRGVLTWKKPREGGVGGGLEMFSGMTPWY